MIIVWKGDYEGTNLKEDLARLHKLQLKIQEKIGGKLESPYFPQDASVLYVFHVEKYEWLNSAGRIYFSEAVQQNLSFFPKSYEVCVTPEEFFGKLRTTKELMILSESVVIPKRRSFFGMFLSPAMR